MMMLAPLLLRCPRQVQAAGARPGLSSCREPAALRQERVVIDNKWSEDSRRNAVPREF